MSPNSDRNDIDAVQLLRYITGDDRLSPAEEENVRARLQADPDWMQLMHSLKSGAPIEWDTEAEWKKLEAKLEGDAAGPATSRRRTSSSRQGRRRRFVNHPFLRVAAILVGVVFSTLLVAQLWQESQTGGASAPAGSDEQVFVTRKGERSMLQLTDGTQVRINVDSKLRLSANFLSGDREVWLDGEAYFKVAPDSTRPFIVHADPATVQVLGTEFDVSVYSGEPEVRVVVAEGKVAMRSRRTSSEEFVALTARQMGRLSRTGRTVVRTEVDPDRHLAWMDGELIFEDAPFDEVVRKLERWYDLDIDQDDSMEPAGHLNASFTERQSMNEVLDVVATAFGLSYAQEGKTIKFLPVKPTSS